MMTGYKRYEIAVFITSFFSTFICMLVNKPSSYTYVWTIPAAFTFCFVVSKNLHIYSARNSGLFLLNIIMFIKYVCAVLIVCITKNFEIPQYYKVSVSNSSFNWAIFYIVVEIFSIFITIRLFSDSLYKRKSIRKLEGIRSYSESSSGIVVKAFFLLSVALILLNFGTYIQRSLIVFSNGNSLTEKFESNNVLFLIFNCFNVLAMGVLVNQFIIKYERTQLIRYVILSYLVFALYIFLSISTSRRDIIMPFVLFIILTRGRFQRTGTLLNIISALVLVLVFSIVTVYKTPWLFWDDTSIIYVLRVFTNGAQEYTSNVLPTAIGLQTIDHYGRQINILTLFRDIFGSVPWVSHFFDTSKRLYYMYNTYALRDNTASQIIPMTASSIGYFSPLFCWFLVAFCSYILMFFDSQPKKKETFLDEYLNLFLLYNFAAALTSNVQILSGRYFTRYLLPALMLYLDKRIIIRSKPSL